MKRVTVDAGGLRLQAVETGKGPGVLVLHGFTGDAESMAPVAEALDARHRVVRLELVGHGGSDAPDDSRLYTMDACARQVRAAANALGLERPHLVGYSMGGRAALAAAIAFPEAFGRLVLIGATAGIEDSAARAERVVSDDALAARIVEEGIERFVEEWMALPLFASQRRLGSDALERARAQRLRNSPQALAASLRGMGAGAQTPLFDRLHEVRAPVLLVVGEEDAKFRAIARDLASRLSDARIACLPEAGHAAHLEAPRAFASVVGPFLAPSADRASETTASSTHPSALDAGGAG